MNTIKWRKYFLEQDIKSSGNNLKYNNYIITQIFLTTNTQELAQVQQTYSFRSKLHRIGHWLQNQFRPRSHLHGKASKPANPARSLHRNSFMFLHHRSSKKTKESIGDDSSFLAWTGFKHRSTLQQLSGHRVMTVAAIAFGDYVSILQEDL